jgi:hypothetical protein
MTPARRNAEGLKRSGSIGDQLACGLTSVLLLFSVGRVGELFPLIGSLPVVKLLMALLVITIIVNRGAVLDWRLFGSGPVRLTIALAVICCVSITYSVWRRQTLDFLTSQLLIVIALVVLVSGIGSTLARLRWLTTVVMFAAVPLAVEVVFSTASGRRQAGLTYDPNDLAFLIGALLPLLLVRAPFVSNRLTRWVLYGVVILYLVAAVLTQSRGGMTGIASMAIFLAWVGIGQISSRGDFVTGRSGRWVRIALVLCFGALSMLFMPHDAKQRLGTVFDISDDYNLVVSEDGSGRLAIWKRGLETLAERPWGVGANVYGVADALAGGRYMTAHNSLLQVFVELGVPGGLIFISMLVSTWRMNGSVRKGILARKPTPERSELLALTTGLRASMVAIVVAGSFLSQAYGLVLFVIIALSVASAMVSEAECSGDEPNSKKILQTRMPRRSGRVPVAPRSSAAHLH